MLAEYKQIENEYKLKRYRGAQIWEGGHGITKGE